MTGPGASPTNAQPTGGGHGAVTVPGRRRELVTAMALTITLHLVLLTAQASAAALTGSVAIGANAIHLGVGALIHLAALGGVWLATRPADSRHPYGYERYEALASLLIGMLLLVAMALIVASAVPRLAQAEPIRASALGIAVMAASAMSTAVLAYYLRRRGRRLNSLVLKSEALHAVAGSFVAVGVVVAVALGALGVPWPDPIVALGVAAVVAWRGWGVVRGAAAILTDAAAIDIDAIRAAALTVPGVRDCHAVRSRGEAGHVRVDLHVHVAPELTIVEAHRIASEVEERIRGLNAGIAEVLVHLGADQSVV